MGNNGILARVVKLVIVKGADLMIPHEGGGGAPVGVPRPRVDKIQGSLRTLYGGFRGCGLSVWLGWMVCQKSVHHRASEPNLVIEVFFRAWQCY